MSNLSRQHGDLPAMMRVMRDEIAEKSRHIGTKVLDAAVAVQRRLITASARGD